MKLILPLYNQALSIINLDIAFWPGIRVQVGIFL